MSLSKLNSRMQAQSLLRFAIDQIDKGNIVIAKRSIKDALKVLPDGDCKGFGQVLKELVQGV